MAYEVVVAIKECAGLVVEPMQGRISFTGLRILIRAVQLSGLNLIPEESVI